MRNMTDQESGGIVTAQPVGSERKIAADPVHPAAPLIQLALSDEISILSLRRCDGTVSVGIEAQFSGQMTLIMDVAKRIEVGDMLIQTLPSRLRVGLIVDDPKYHEALGVIPSHFEVKTHHAAPICGRPRGRRSAPCR